MNVQREGVQAGGSGGVGDGEGRWWGRKRVRVREGGGEKCRDVSTKGLMLRNTGSPSLSPSPPHYPPAGRARGSRHDIFICSFKGSLLSPFKRKPFSLSRSVSFFSLPLSQWKFSFRVSLLPVSPSPSCSIIAWLINYKGISKSEKRSWHFNLRRNEPCT